jgi:outer membrane protein assembly factor BamA
LKHVVLVLLLFLLLHRCAVAAGLPVQNDSTITRKVGVLPLPAFGYSPETRWYAGAVVLLTARLHQDALTRTSNFKVEGNYTQNKQLILSSEWNVFSKADRLFFSGEAAYLKFPENFYGIGNRTTEAMEENYDSKRIEFNATLLRRLPEYWYLGPRYQLQHMYAIVPSPEGILENSDVPGSEGGTSSGAGLAIAFDNRRNILNPQQGAYALLAVTSFHKTFGSNFQFTSFELDLRKYIPLPWRHLLAMQGYGVFNSGNPPFRMMGLLGSDSDMRGYYRGRFRDRQYMAFQAEYRFPILWRIGGTAFGGAGDVAPQLRAFELQEFKPSYGLGLRFLIDRQENINLRFDYAVGKDGANGFYVSFGEAF